MPRPSLADVRRPQILEAYARCLVSYGWEGSTLDRIAEEAGVTRALVRHYLGNRDEVDRALVEHLRARYVDWFQGLGRGVPPSRRLSAIVDALLTTDPEEPTQVVDALFAASKDRPELQDALRSMYRELEQLVETELAAAHPGADPGRRRTVAYGLVCLVGMHRSLDAIGFPSERAIQAKACADRLVADLA